jgi:hypothetical protein
MENMSKECPMLQGQVSSSTCFSPREIPLSGKKPNLCLAHPINVSLTNLPPSEFLHASTALVFAQDIANVVVLDDVRCVSKTLRVDSVNSHGEDHLALIDDLLNAHNVGHTDAHSTSLDTSSLAVDIGFEVSEREDMLLADGDVAFFSLLDMMAETVTVGQSVENGAREDGETLAELVAVATCSFVFDSQGFGLARVLQHKLSIILHTKVDDQALEEGCSVAKRVQPIHDLVLDLELGFLSMIVFGNRRFFSKDAESVDGKVEGQDTFAKELVDAGQGRSCGRLEQDDFIVGSGNGKLDDHVQNLARQIEQRKHSSGDMVLGEIFSRFAGHCGIGIGRFVVSSLVLADIFDDLFANLGALLCLKACLTHGQF